MDKHEHITFDLVGRTMGALMKRDLVNDLASAAWHVMNFDNDPKIEPEGPSNWNYLVCEIEKVLKKHRIYRPTPKPDGE